MTLIKVPERRVAEPVTLRGILTIDYAVCETIGRAERTAPAENKTFPLRGVKVNDLSVLWPYSHLRSLALQGAKQFTADLAKRGYRLLTNEADVVVFGPYRGRGWQRQPSGDLKAIGRQEGEDPFPEAVDFLLIGEFLATRGYVPDEPTQALIERARRAADEDGG